MISWKREEKARGLSAVVQSKHGRGYQLHDTVSGAILMTVFKDQRTDNWRFLVIRPGRAVNAISKKEWPEIADALEAAKRWWKEVGAKATGLKESK